MKANPQHVFLYDLTLQYLVFVALEEGPLFRSLLCT